MTFSTPAQVAANQANAQHSTGPKTAAGKAIVAQNNFRHGFTGAFRVLDWENQEDHRALQLALEKGAPARHPSPANRPPATTKKIWHSTSATKPRTTGLSTER
jgi:hypothetical protein